MQIQSHGQRPATSSILPIKSCSCTIAKEKFAQDLKDSKNSKDSESGASGSDGEKGSSRIPMQIQDSIDNSVNQVSEQFSQDLEIINGVNTNPYAGSEDASIARHEDTMACLEFLAERLASLIELLNKLKNESGQPVSESEVQKMLAGNVVGLMMNQMSDMNSRVTEILRNPPDYTLSEVSDEERQKNKRKSRN